jgi:hypothetical protein
MFILARLSSASFICETLCTIRTQGALRYSWVPINTHGYHGLDGSTLFQRVSPYLGGLRQASLLPVFFGSNRIYIDQCSFCHFDHCCVPWRLGGFAVPMAADLTSVASALMDGAGAIPARNANTQADILRHLHIHSFIHSYTHT